MIKKQEFTVLKTTDLYPFPENPFRMAADETLTELAESIREFGIVTPIIVRPKDDGNGYEIIAGQRRVRASEPAGIETVTGRLSLLLTAISREKISCPLSVRLLIK